MTGPAASRVSFSIGRNRSLIQAFAPSKNRPRTRKSRFGPPPNLFRLEKNRPFVFNKLCVILIEPMFRLEILRSE
jgi:hypothetical protein